MIIFLKEIIDSGVGTHSETLRSLLDKPATGGHGFARPGQGSGLGLFINKAIVKAHGGHVKAYNNADGKDATIVIALPVVD